MVILSLGSSPFETASCRKELVQRVNVFVHQVIRFVFPAGEHGQALVVDDEMLITGLCADLSARCGNNRTYTDAVIQEAPEFPFECRRPLPGDKPVLLSI